ncbi:MAG: glycosyltransferase family 9 protein [Candidatus Omnitrophota bacterium]
MKKVLIANIFGIGDVLFTSPMIANLKRNDPDVKVDYVCNIRTMDIVNRLPGVDDIYVYEKDLFTQVWNESKIRFLKTTHNLFKEIKEQEYDVLFDLTLSRELGLFFKLAGIKRRVGLDYKKRGVFLTDRIPFSGFNDKHVVEYYLDCLRHLKTDVTVKAMSLFSDEISQEIVLSHLREKGVDEMAGPLVGIVPGGGASWGNDASRKRWNAESFAEVADALMEKGSAVAILGDKNEADLCRNITGRMKLKPVITSNNMILPDFIAFLNACDLVVCNDGGPLHMAGALGVRTVSVFGPVNEKVYGPYPASDDHIVIKGESLSCRPCYNSFRLPHCGNNNECLDGISAGQVTEACLGLLDQVKP